MTLKIGSWENLNNDQREGSDLCLLKIIKTVLGSGYDRAGVFRSKVAPPPPKKKKEDDFLHDSFSPKISEKRSRLFYTM
jgi:hypothetical protein